MSVVRPHLFVIILAVTFFVSIIIKVCQDACLGDCSDEFEHDSSRIKTRSPELKIEKPC
jgi:hypothetical protein